MFALDTTTPLLMSEIVESSPSLLARSEKPFTVCWSVVTRPSVFEMRVEREEAVCWSVEMLPLWSAIAVANPCAVCWSVLMFPSLSDTLV